MFTYVCRHCFKFYYRKFPTALKGDANVFIICSSKFVNVQLFFFSTKAMQLYLTTIVSATTKQIISSSPIKDQVYHLFRSVKSVHLFLGLPRSLFSLGLQDSICFGSLASNIFSMWFIQFFFFFFVQFQNSTL